ncbi:MAG TPA: ABC transporter permease subunit [Pseudomonadales bacterium]|jgi:microcin C transport system permease protein|nr:ABC transporter permease subunit [Pseudomonadales bacterium]HNN86511.1 ABC transporter permease subunit [Pseudomonadales bacterium]
MRKWQHFRALKRGYWSAIILAALIILSCGAELIANNRALIVHYNGEYFFPTYGAFLPGTAFGLNYPHETNYRDLQQQFRKTIGNKNWVVMPAIPWNPLESHAVAGLYPPLAPSLAYRHFLGTDGAGRDIAARLLYGFRLSIAFSILLLLCNYSIGTVIGIAMGFYGGKFDLIMQRVIEIWSSIPTLYVIMIIASLVLPGFWTLLFIMAFFDWTAITWYMRTTSYKEKARNYVLAARALGASDWRIITQHLLPNTRALLITFAPFSITGGITALTALDYLGFGLPPPTPSWGVLLREGMSRLDSEWIVGSVTIAMIAVLVMVTWIGEALREAFDPKQRTVYE